MVSGTAVREEVRVLPTVQSWDAKALQGLVLLQGWSSQLTKFHTQDSYPGRAQWCDLRPDESGGSGVQS